MEKLATSAEANYELGLWCEEHKLKDLAELHFEAAVKHDKSYEPAHQKLGHVRLGDQWIWGDELREAQDMLNFVHDYIDIGHHTFDFESAFGPELAVHGSAQNFENKWEDGKNQLKKQIEGIRDAIGNILDSFEKTDQDAASNLDDGQGGQ